jgi:hypothetical protein
MQLYPFSPSGNTVLSGVTNASATINVANAGTNKIPQQILIQNLSTNVVYFAFAATVAIPVAGTPANGIPVQAGVTVVYTPTGGDATLGATISVIAGVAGPSSVTFTPGEGS